MSLLPLGVYKGWRDFITGKTILLKHKDVRKDLFHFYLKECEFRFNYKNEDQYQKLLEIVGENHLGES